MASTIPLAKPYTPGKLVFPVALSRKVDGVPVKITFDNLSIRVESRQGKRVESVTALIQDFREAYLMQDLPVPVTFVGEVYQRGNMDADFKETSGIVRRQYDQSDQLAIALFDTDTGIVGEHSGQMAYSAANFEHRLHFLMYLKQIKLHEWVKPIDQFTVNTIEELENFAASHATAFPKAEGMVARSYTDEWAPGKRTWGYQKVVVDPMIDLRIVGFEEAIDQYGHPMGMVGRLVAKYRGDTIGIGPGKLNHAERISLWKTWQNTANYSMQVLDVAVGPTWHNPIAQIKHKADDSYDALRQPTFQCWREDKDEPDA